MNNKTASHFPAIRFPEFDDDWQSKQLRELLNVSGVKNRKNQYSRDRVLSVSRELGIINQIEHLGRSYAGAALSNYNVVNVGDIVYTKSPLKNNPYGIIKTNKKNSGIVSTLYAVYKAKSGFNPNFIDRYFELDDRTNKYLRPLVHKGAKNDMKISNERVLIDPIIVPTLPEQTKITSFFSSIDEWIANLRRQNDELEKYKKGVYQQIFSQKKRFHDSNGVVFSKWEIKSVGDVIQEYKLKSEMNNEHPVLTSSRSGLIPQSDYYGQENRITDRDNKGFNIVPHGYITYRSRSDDGVFHFNQNNLGYTGLVSVYYPVFKNKCGSNYFLVALLNYNWKTLYKYSVGTSQKVLSLSELKKIKLFFPTAEEQERIEMLLLGVEELINNKERQIALAEQWKKGLLQQMFV